MLKDTTEVSISMSCMVVILGLVVIGLVFVGSALNLYTLPWQENLKREGFQHSRSVVEGHVSELSKLLAEYNALEAKANFYQNDESLYSYYTASKGSVIRLMWDHYDAIPNDIRNQEVPSDIQIFLMSHPRGSK